MPQKTDAGFMGRRVPQVSPLRPGTPRNSTRATSSCERARLHRTRKTRHLQGLVSGHDFSRAENAAKTDAGFSPWEPISEQLPVWRW